MLLDADNNEIPERKITTLTNADVDWVKERVLRIPVPMEDVITTSPPTASYTCDGLCTKCLRSNNCSCYDTMGMVLMQRERGVDVG